MKTRDIKADKFYQTRSGEVVRVASAASGFDGNGKGWLAYGKDSPSAFWVGSRDLVKEVPEPARETLQSWVDRKAF